MKKVAFSIILILLVFVFCGAIAETLVEMPFGLKWTESFSFENGVQFGMTKKEVNSHVLENAEYQYNESGLLSSVVLKFPLKDYDFAYSDYEDLENQLNKNYGEPIGTDLICPNTAIIDEMSISGESRHTNRIIIEGKNKLITIEHYLLGRLDRDTTDHYRLLVYSIHEGNDYGGLLLWHFKHQNFY